MPNPKKVRVDFRKNRAEKVRTSDWTSQFHKHGFETDAPVVSERVSGKGDVVRKRTVFQEANTEYLLKGRVLQVNGLHSIVESDDVEAGQIYQCVTRRILKTVTTDQRHVVVCGDRVEFRDANQQNRHEGFIENVLPRKGIIARNSKGRKHVIVANVDLAVIVVSAAEPPLKPNLIDRFLISIEKEGIEPLICINKIDLVSLASLQPIIGLYSQIGYQIIPVCAKTGFGMDRLKDRMKNIESVVAGQSGVGKSSILNAIDPTLNLRIGNINADTMKGTHTTTTSQLLKLNFGGYIVDTPGIRQFSLWDVIPKELLGFFRDLRPYENKCHFPDCTHTHEEDCAIKNAVADGILDMRRYESYLAAAATENGEAILRPKAFARK